MAEELDYVPMPDNVVNDIQKMWSAEIKDGSGKPLFSPARFGANAAASGRCVGDEVVS